METENVKDKGKTEKIIKFILISGNVNRGKTSVCNRLHDMIALNATFTVHDKKKTQNGTKDDFIAHYEKDGKHIMMNTPSDKDDCMIELCQYLDALAKDGVRPEIVITSVRAKNGRTNDAPHAQTSHMAALLEAIGNGTGNLEKHFNQNIASTTAYDLTSLKHHVFVLHLDKYDDEEIEENPKAACAPYWDDNADKLKYALDFALARL